MKKLKLPKSSYYILCVLATVLILAMTPLVASAAIMEVDANSTDQFSPNGVDTGETFTIAPGDTIHWVCTGDCAPHTVNNGDTTGGTCTAETLTGVLPAIGATYDHTFGAAQ